MNQQSAMTMQVQDRLANEVFALTDEQILGMEAEGQEIEIDPVTREQGNARRGPSNAAATAAASAPFDSAQGRRDDIDRSGRRNERGDAAESLTPKGVSYRDAAGSQDGKSAQPGMAVLQEPPAWLAREMNDPWVGDEARELWEGVQRAQREAAAYREAFATPEDARALKEIYPGGVAEAKGAAERARELAEIDGVFLGAVGKPAEELRAGRTALVERLYAQNPGAFREMVEAGVRILGAGGGRSSEAASLSQNAITLPGSLRPGDARGTQNTRSESQTARLSGLDDRFVHEQMARADESGEAHPDGKSAQPGMAVPQEVASRYREFERSTNAELEKSVGGAIGRAMEAALPNLSIANAGVEGQATPLQSRLANAVREEVEEALRSDASLGEQVARVLSGRRLDEAARAQVVRLIDTRAQQLVPGAVRRVVGSWTQATLGARKTDAGGESVGRGADERRAEWAPNSSQRSTSGNSGGERNAQTAGRGVPRGRVDYRKFSDEQILGM